MPRNGGIPDFLPRCALEDLEKENCGEEKQINPNDKLHNIEASCLMVWDENLNILQQNRELCGEDYRPV